MPWIVGVLIIWLITAASLYIISKLPFVGVVISSPQKALVSAAVFGILNALLGPILRFLAFPITFLTLGLFAIVINAIIFGLAAYLVQGFRLEKGFLSAILGAILLGLINSLIIQILARAGLQIAA
ncbi:MAG: phage holin family protein [Leptolyngbyaceae cyanobacterium SL_5_9]|jgi:putative membrane protein|nr:phage holin family protein [Leptolyngbyaceae cyanobacterium SL_5_9]NJO76476.1 phage holin family protein [Leptolyngbyaceae cyanobacterium RM1_406_9]